MHFKVRIVSYSILFLVYCFSIPILLSLNKYMLSNMTTNLCIGFSVLNISYSFISLRWGIWQNILISIIISFISLFLALKIGDLRLFPNDAYGILTSIISNAVLSVFFWEIAYQAKTSNVKNK